MKKLLTSQSPAPQGAESNSHSKRRRILRRPPAALPDGEIDGASANLLPGDDPASFHSLRAKAHLLAGNPSGYNSFLADLLAEQTWELARNSILRSSAFLLQLSDDQPHVDQEFDTIDDGGRQYLSWRKLAADASYRQLLNEADRTHRRRRQTHSDLLRSPKDH